MSQDSGRQGIVSVFFGIIPGRDIFDKYLLETRDDDCPDDCVDAHSGTTWVLIGSITTLRRILPRRYASFLRCILVKPNILY